MFVLDGLGIFFAIYIGVLVSAGIIFGLIVLLSMIVVIWGK